MRNTPGWIEHTIMRFPLEISFYQVRLDGGVRRLLMFCSNFWTLPKLRRELGDFRLTGSMIVEVRSCSLRAGTIRSNLLTNARDYGKLSWSRFVWFALLRSCLFRSWTFFWKTCLEYWHVVLVPRKKRAPLQPPTDFCCMQAGTLPPTR